MGEKGEGGASQLVKGDSDGESDGQKEDETGGQADDEEEEDT